MHSQIRKMFLFKRKITFLNLLIISFKKIIINYQNKVLNFLFKKYYIKCYILVNSLHNRVKAPSPPPISLLNQNKVQPVKLLKKNRRSLSQPAIAVHTVENLKSMNIAAVKPTEMLKTNKDFSTFESFTLKSFLEKNTTKNDNVKDDNASTGKTDVSIDYSLTSSSISDHKSASWPDQKVHQTSFTKQIGLRRSWSSSVLDFRYCKLETMFFIVILYIIYINFLSVVLKC